MWIPKFLQHFFYLFDFWAFYLSNYRENPRFFELVYVRINIYQTFTK